MFEPTSAATSAAIAPGAAGTHRTPARVAGYIAAAAFTLAAIALIAAVPARAAFPGANGKIAFTRCNTSSCDDGDIWSTGAGGSGPLHLTSGTGSYDEEPSYSADGRRIAFEHCGPGFTVGCAIEVMNSDGTGLKKLTDGAHFDWTPSFSPDGARVVFARSTGSGDQILTVPSGGGALTPLTSGTAYDGSPKFSPDGTKIVFERYIPATTDSIWVMNANGSGQTALTHQDPSASDTSPDWSPDGTKIVFDRLDTTVHERRVWMMAANGANAHQLRNPGPGVGEDQPAFSPDGTQIAFESFRGSASPIEVMNVDGSGSRVLTNAGNREYAPSWQPAAPTLSGSPTITGKAVNGQALAATATAAVGGGATVLQWLRCDGSGQACAAIHGASAASYTLTSADIGHAIRVMETQTNRVGPASATSAPTSSVAANPAACSNAFTGTSGNDTLHGTPGGDLILGLAGNDVLSGAARADCISGNQGNDGISGGGGNDKLSGGPGKDRITGGNGKDTIVAGPGDDVIDAADGVRDSVSCGGGKDAVRADHGDKLRGCEHVVFVSRKR